MPASPPKRSTFRPQLEALEDRWMPSILTVTNTKDSGPHSLRAEIAHANNKDTIVFSPKLDGMTITLTSGELDITKNLTIQGLGAGLLTISGNGPNSSRVFEVAQNTAVTLSGLTISNGDGYASFGDSGPMAGFGGGILNQGTLTVSGCTVSDNGSQWSDGGFPSSFSVSNGGGIYNDGTLTISGCTISGNQASAGGGILSQGTLTVAGCTVSANTAWYGGGIENFRGTLTVAGCTISGNSAFYGGGIFNGGTATVRNSTLSGNEAIQPGGGIVSPGAGGGIYNDGTLTVSGCTISGNVVAYGGEGGGIYNTGALTVSNSAFSGNYPHNIFGSFTDGGGNTFS